MKKTLKKRIYGIETEYGVFSTSSSSRRFTPDEIARHLFRRVIIMGRSSNVFLENGSRLYLDVGSHPEYATPECDSIHDLVVYDKAGERMLEELADYTEKYLAEHGEDVRIHLFKNNTDSAGNSYGCHENYLTTRYKDFGLYVEKLVPFLVSRQIYAGAGKILKTSKGARYCLSQRAEHVWEETSSATTRSRPIINTRDEPHADAEHYRRLHVIVGDSNMSEYANLLKVGACSILLKMIEETPFSLDLSLENPIVAIREISSDITCRIKVRLADGRQLTALQIQTRYLEAAQKYAASHDLDIHEMQALEYWEHCLKGIEKDPFSLKSECDWVAKYHLIEEYRQRHNLLLENPALSRIDLQYHEIKKSPKNSAGFYYLMEKEGLMQRICTDAEVEEAAKNPPQTTRARLRGEFIQQAKKKNREYTVDWVHLKLNDQEQRTVLCKDPFVSSDERVQKLLESL